MKKLLTLFLFLATSPLYAATFYVDCSGGNNGNSGTSPAKAWKSVSKVNSSVNGSGDDVYFKAGCTWNETLVIDWGGKSSNRAIVGAYYMSNGTPTIGVPKGTSKPRFKGTCVKKGNCPVDVANAIPNSRWSPLVSIKGNYTTVQNLKVQNSSGAGIAVHGTKAGNEQNHHNFIINNTAENILMNGIFLGRTSHTNVIRGNTITKASMVKPYGHHSNWPAAIGLALADSSVIEDNYIYHSFGEAIGIFDRSHFNIIRNNVVMKGNKPGIYVSCSRNNIVENNKVMGDRTDPLAKLTDGYPDIFAYGTTSETYCDADTKGNIFRNNLAANVRYCFYNTIETGAANNGYRTTNNSFYNNNCVNSYSGFTSISNGGSGNAYATFTNNLITDVDVDCIQVDNKSSVNFNHWDKTPSDADCRGSNDVYGDPKLNVNSGWNNITVSNIPPDSSFNVASSSSVLYNGLSLATAKTLTTTNYPQANLVNSCQFDQTHNSYDRHCKKRSSPDSIGAFSNNVVANKVPAPSGLSMTIKSN